MITLDNLHEIRSNLANAMMRIRPGMDEFAVLQQAHDGLKLIDSLVADIQFQFERRLHSENQGENWQYRCPCGAVLPNSYMFALHAKTCPSQHVGGYLPGQNVGLPPGDSVTVKRLPPSKP